MKKIIFFPIILLLATITLAQNTTNQTSNSTFQFPTVLKDVYSFLTYVNPFLLLILGLILIFASKLANFVGIVLIIIAIIHILFLFFI